MKKTFRLVSLFWMCMLLLVLSACGGTKQTTTGQQNPTQANPQTDASGGSKKPRFAVVLKQLNTDYWRIVMKGAKDAAAMYGADVEFLGPAAETQYEEQIRMIEDQIVRKVDGLLVAPNQPDATLPVFKKAKDAGIPVILLDTDAKFEDKVSFIGTGNFKAGELAGKFIADKLSNGDKVAIIRGTTGNQTHNDREDGFKKALESKNLKYIVQDAQCDRAKSVSVMEDIATANPDLKAVFATCDESALGVLKALEGAGKNNIPVIGFDGTPNGLEALKAGKLVAEVAQDPYMIGYLGVQTAVKVTKGEQVEKRIDSGAKLITQDNVEEEMKKIADYLE